MGELRETFGLHLEWFFSEQNLRRKVNDTTLQQSKKKIYVYQGWRRNIYIKKKKSGVEENFFTLLHQLVMFLATCRGLKVMPRSLISYPACANCIVEFSSHCPSTICSVLNPTEATASHEKLMLVLEGLITQMVRNTRRCPHPHKKSYFCRIRSITFSYFPLSEPIKLIIFIILEKDIRYTVKIIMAVS